MVSKKIESQMKRTPIASCLKCSRLHTLCHPSIREGILSNSIEVCDFARWGCENYSGPGEKTIKGAMGIVYGVMLDGKQRSARGLAEELGMDRQIISNNISRIMQRGVEVKKQMINGTLFYKIEL